MLKVKVYAFPLKDFMKVLVQNLPTERCINMHLNKLGHYGTVCIVAQGIMENNLSLRWINWY